MSIFLILQLTVVLIQGLLLLFAKPGINAMLQSPLFGLNLIFMCLGFATH